ncbi:unnamed protein product, partial [Staurois parvus]
QPALLPAGPAILSASEQCQLSVSISASCQCSSIPHASSHQCHIKATFQCLPVHINAHLSCLSVSPISASQCHLSVLPLSAAYQCHQSVCISAA